MNLADAMEHLRISAKLRQAETLFGKITDTERNIIERSFTNYRDGLGETS